MTFCSRRFLMWCNSCDGVRPPICSLLNRFQDIKSPDFPVRFNIAAARVSYGDSFRTFSRLSDIFIATPGGRFLKTCLNFIWCNAHCVKYCLYLCDVVTIYYVAVGYVGVGCGSAVNLYDDDSRSSSKGVFGYYCRCSNVDQLGYVVMFVSMDFLVWTY